MTVSDINSYNWRSLTDEEYNKLKNDIKSFYFILDLIVYIFITGLSGSIVKAIIDTFNNINEIFSLLAPSTAIIVLLIGRKFIRNLGFKDIENKNYEAAEGIFKERKTDTLNRHGKSINQSYALVLMPDNKYLLIEEELSKINKLNENDKGEYLFNIL